MATSTSRLTSYAKCRVIIGCPKTEAIMQWVGLRRLTKPGSLGQDSDVEVQRYVLGELRALQRALSQARPATTFRGAAEFASTTPSTLPPGVEAEMSRLWSKFLSDVPEHLRKLRGLIDDNLFVENYPYTFNIMRTAYSQFEPSSVHQHAAKRNRFYRRSLPAADLRPGQAVAEEEPQQEEEQEEQEEQTETSMWPLFTVKPHDLSELSSFLSLFLDSNASVNVAMQFELQVEPTWSEKDRRRLNWALYYITNLLLKDLFVGTDEQCYLGTQIPQKTRTVLLMRERQLANKLVHMSTNLTDMEMRELLFQDTLGGAESRRYDDGGMVAEALGFDNDTMNAVEIINKDLGYLVEDIVDGAKKQFIISGGGGDVKIAFAGELSDPSALVRCVLELLHTFFTGVVMEYVRRITTMTHVRVSVQQRLSTVFLAFSEAQGVLEQLYQHYGMLYEMPEPTGPMPFQGNATAAKKDMLPKVRARDKSAVSQRKKNASDRYFDAGSKKPELFSQTFDTQYKGLQTSINKQLGLLATHVRNEVIQENQVIERDSAEWFADILLGHATYSLAQRAEADLVAAATKQQLLEVQTEAAIKSYQALHRGKKLASARFAELSYYKTIVAYKLELLAYVVSHVQMFRSHYQGKAGQVTVELVNQLVGEALEAFVENLQNLLQHVVLQRGKKLLKQLEDVQKKVDDEALLKDNPQERERRGKLGYKFSSGLSGALGALKELVSDKLMPYKQGQNVLMLINVFTKDSVVELLDFFDAVHGDKPQKFVVLLAQEVARLANANYPSESSQLAAADSGALGAIHSSMRDKAIEIAQKLDNKQYVKAVVDLNPLISTTSSSSHADSVKQLTSAGRTRYVRSAAAKH